jgi:hypothetical protein
LSTKEVTRRCEPGDRVSLLVARRDVLGGLRVTAAGLLRVDATRVADAKSDGRHRLRTLS